MNLDATQIGALVTLISAMGALIGAISSLVVVIKNKSGIAAVHTLVNDTHSQAVARNAQLEDTISNLGYTVPPHFPTQPLPAVPPKT